VVVRGIAQASTIPGAKENRNRVGEYSSTNYVHVAVTFTQHVSVLSFQFPK